VRWLTLLLSLPPTPTRHRVGVWRQGERMGALRLRDAAWILPDTSATTELFQWLVQEIRSFRGEAPLGARAPRRCGRSSRASSELDRVRKIDHLASPGSACPGSADRRRP
jgi:hypothetical protein